MELQAGRYTKIVNDKKPTTQDGSFPLNTEKINSLPSVLEQTQKELMEIEKDFEQGGNYIMTITKDMRVVVGAATNTTPQARVDPKGRRIVSVVGVTNEGVIPSDGGAPVVEEISGPFPCGNYSVEAGNNITMLAGTGGVDIVSLGGASLVSESVTRVGGLQTVVAGQDVTIVGDKNVSIQSGEGGTLNLTSDTQVVIDGNLGVKNNIVVGGGVYSEGELFVNHITGPREIQQTIVGFTADGAEGYLKLGSWISGVALIGGPVAAGFALGANSNLETQLYQGFNQLYPFFDDYYNVPSSASAAPSIKFAPIKIFLGAQLNNAVELNPHGHEFPTLPMTLVESKGNKSANKILREQAIVLNENAPAPATPLLDGPKYDKSSIRSILAAILTSLFSLPGASKNYNVTGV